MGRWTSESSGADVLRRIAKQRLNDPSALSRVWSDHMSAWGFYDSCPTESDVFLIMCSAKPGDLFLPGNKCHNLFTVPDCKVIMIIPENNHFVVVKSKEFEFHGTRLHGLELLGFDPPQLCQMLAQNTTLVKIAWEFLK